MIRLRGEKSDARFVQFVFYCPRFWISMFSHTWHYNHWYWGDVLFGRDGFIIKKINLNA